MPPASSKLDRDWFQYNAASVSGVSEERLILTVRRRPEGRIDVYVTSLALGLVSSFPLSSAAGGSEAVAKFVMLVDDDQGFFVLNHGHPLSPKQGYVILDAGV